MRAYWGRGHETNSHQRTPDPNAQAERPGRGGVEGPAGTANAVPLFTVVRIAVPLFKAGRTGAANVPHRMRDCVARVV